MRVNGKPYRTLWVDDDGWSLRIIDQTRLPHAFETLRLQSADDAARAIKVMQVRGAPLIGITGAYGLALALRADPGDRNLGASLSLLLATRPTGANLKWALERVRALVEPLRPDDRAAAAYREAAAIADEDVEINRSIGTHGLRLIQALADKKPRGAVVNLLTHCDAGWLGTADWGTAHAPIFMAADAGLRVHVWVSETRPRNQGAALSAWEFSSHGVPHTVIADNAAGHLMQHGKVDLIIVGADRVTSQGDTANKVGTYLKALAAFDNGVPFYVALPSPTIDWTLRDGRAEIIVEERDPREVTHIGGVDAAGIAREVRLTPEGTAAANPAFDVTPARLIRGLITEKGLCPATPAGLRSLFPSLGLSEGLLSPRS